MTVDQEMGQEVDSDTAEAAPNRPLGRRRLVIAVAVAAALVSGGGLAASTMIRSPAQAAADTRPPAPSLLTAPVVKRVLANTTVLRGTFVTGQQYPVLPTAVATTSDGPGGGPLVVTALKTAAGRSVSAGKAVAEISGRPVFTLPGAVPVYRDMLPGESGPDIGQLQEDLHAVGISTGGDRPKYFGSGTKAAVTRWYHRLGYAVPITGDTTAQAVQTARLAVQQQQQAVTDLRSEIASGGHAPGSGSAAGAGSTAKAGATSAGASAGTGSSAGTGDAGASLTVQLSRAKTLLSQDRQVLGAAEAKDGPEVPSSELVFLPSYPARVDSVPAHVGDHVTTAVMSLTAGGLTLTGHLQPTDAPLVKVGMKVTILNESTGMTATGRIGAVSAQVDPSQQTTGGSSPGPGTDQNTGGTAYVPITVDPDKPWDPSLAGQDVRITVVAASTAGEVLAVPAAAITSGVDGRTSVTVVAADHSRHTVQVTAGVTADNYVQITPVGAALKPGDQVVVGK